MKLWLMILGVVLATCAAQAEMTPLTLDQDNEDMRRDEIEREQAVLFEWGFLNGDLSLQRGGCLRIQGTLNLCVDTYTSENPYGVPSKLGAQGRFEMRW